MRKSHFLIIALIFGVILIFPVSAGVPVIKYQTVDSAIFKQTATQIPIVPFDYQAVKPYVIPWKQTTPVGTQISVSSKLINNSLLISPASEIIPKYSHYMEPEGPFILTITVWNKDHSRTVPGASITVIKFIFPEQRGEGQIQGFTGRTIATGTTDANGKITIGLPRYESGEIMVRGPTVVENGKRVFYNNAIPFSYESYSVDIALEYKETEQ